MLEILLLMSAGILTGYLLKKHQGFINFVQKTAGFSIYILLFLLGLSVGGNNTVISNFVKIGFNAFIIAFSSIAGSILLLIIAHRLFFRDDGL